MTIHALNACRHILLSPRQGFHEIKNKSAWSWAPFGLIMGSLVVLFLYFFSAVDFDWLINQMKSQTPGLENPSNPQVQSIDNLSPQVMFWATTFGATFGIIVSNTFYALFLYLVVRASRYPTSSYSRWFGLTWWISLPVVVSSALATLIILLSTDGMITINGLSPLSLGNFFNPPSHWYGLMDTITPFLVWSVGLAAIGLHIWLDMDLKVAAIIAATPNITIYSVWGIYIMVSH